MGGSKMVLIQCITMVNYNHRSVVCFRYDNHGTEKIHLSWSLESRDG